MNWRSKVIDEAAAWVQTPYHHKAGIKGVGVDCAHLLIRVYCAAGCIPDIDPGEYPPDWHLHRGEPKFLNWVEQFAVRTSSPQPGDMLLLKYGRVHSHGAIIERIGTHLHVIHAARDLKKVARDDIPDYVLHDREALYFTFEDKQ